jgi:thioredoxin-dependent peroxiredoxin
MSESKSIVVGQLVPDFSALVQNPNGTENFNLKNTLATGQKVLFIFYPGDDTPGCTAQLCGVRDFYTTYQKYGVKVIGVNPASGESHLKFIQKHDYPFGIIVDENKSIRELFGAVGSFFGKPTTKRSVFLVDLDGKVIFRHFGQQDNEKIFELLESLELKV